MSSFGARPRSPELAPDGADTVWYASPKFIDRPEPPTSRYAEDAPARDCYGRTGRTARSRWDETSNSALLYLHQIFEWVGNEALYDLSRHVSRGLHALPSRWLSTDRGE